mgnify:CR=1 FL=1
MSKDTHFAASASQHDEKYMRRALQLSAMGVLTSHPNPMVGAVIVAQGRIIGEGYHIRPGEGHAEVNAVASVRHEDRPLLAESTIYVTLEPCAHYGRTPPCTELIIRTGIPRCVVGCIDPFAEVSGRGIAQLRAAGTDVRVGVLENDCRRINRRFFTFHSKHRPYITLKWARSADGYIDRQRTAGHAARLSTDATQMHVHQQRSRHDAILVGHRTWELDKPRLDLRHWFGTPPLRCILGKVDTTTLPPGTIAHTTPAEMLADLYERNVQSLLVEGGSKTLQSFIDQRLWDEAWEECGTATLGNGIHAPQMPGEPHKQQKIWGVTFNRWENI